MSYRNKTYIAFYVSQPTTQCNLRYHCAPDLNYYHLIEAWVENNDDLQLYDAHKSTYSVRDTSDFENTLLPRLRERLKNSKNIVLILSDETKLSKALKFELEYGIETLKLPLIIMYPNLEPVNINGCLSYQAKNRLERLSPLKNASSKVPILHIMFNENQLVEALKFPGFNLSTKTEPGNYLL